MSNNENDFGAFLAGFVIGGLVGAATALLLAPQSGEDTRTLIHDRSIELKDLALEKAEEARVKAEAAAAEARTQADKITKLARDRAGQLKTTVQRKVSKGSETIEDAVPTEPPVEG